jgi:hypothetical protein
MHRGVLFVIVAIFTACIAMLATPQIIDRLPASISHYERFDLSPASGSFVQVSILHLDDGFEPAPIGTIKITVDPPSRVLAIIEIDPKTMMARYPGDRWRPSAQTFTPGVVQTVFATTGINSPAASQEANDIVNGVNAIIERKSVSWGSNWASAVPWTTTTRHVPGWYWKACFGGFAAIGLITFILLATRSPKTPSSRYSGERVGERG